MMFSFLGKEIKIDQADLETAVDLLSEGFNSLEAENFLHECGIGTLEAIAIVDKAQDEILPMEEERIEYPRLVLVRSSN